jgi:uncharacterized membrane protein
MKRVLQGLYVGGGIFSVLSLYFLSSPFYYNSNTHFSGFAFGFWSYLIFALLIINILLAIAAYLSNEADKPFLRKVFSIVPTASSFLALVFCIIMEAIQWSNGQSKGHYFQLEYGFVLEVVLLSIVADLFLLSLIFSIIANRRSSKTQPIEKTEDPAQKQ